MFKEIANTAFNNDMFNCRIIARMGKELQTISEQTARLYRAAKELRGIDAEERGGKSALARLLNVLPQLLTNWAGGRPISHEALLTAQERIGCDAIWLRDGVGDMVRGGGREPADLTDVAELINLYGLSSLEDREAILEFVRDLRRMKGDRNLASTPNHKR